MSIRKTGLKEGCVIQRHFEPESLVEAEVVEDL